AEAILGLLIALVCGCTDKNIPVKSQMADEANLALLKNEAEAIKSIEKLGGHVAFKEIQASKYVEGIALETAQTTDADLKLLKNFKDIEWLALGKSQVTDAGLKELRDLKKLKILGLYGSQVTDAGLKELRNLPSLQTLIGPRIGDSGLKEISSLPSLEALF